MENKIIKLRKRKEKAYQDSNFDHVYRNCVDLGQLFMEDEAYNNALKEFREAEQAGEMGGVNIHIAKANRMIAEVYILLQKPTEAINYGLKYLELSRTECDLKEEQRALATLARVYFILAETLEVSDEIKIALRDAEKYNIRSLQVCERLKETTNHKDVAEMKARVYLNLGLVMEAQDHTDKAIDYLEKAVAICKSLDLWDELCLSYTNLGIAYKHLRNSANAVKAFDLALNVASRLSEKAKSMCDILLAKAQVLFELPDFRGAKHALHKAYKLRTPDDKVHMEIQRKLKIVAAVCKLEERLLHINEDDLLERRNIYESMGDGCAEMEFYTKALEYYHLTLKCATELGESGKKISEIYVSLAQTYKDLKQFEKALDYYQQELFIWKNNPAEACKTTLSIIDIMEAKDEISSEVIANYKSAHCLAKDANNMRLQRLVLKTFIRYLEEIKDNTPLLSSLVQELNSVETKLGDDISDESESENEKDDKVTENIGDDICLDTLTDSELDEDNDVQPKSRTSRRANKTFNFRRNEKGETPLHTACINGNLSLVQRLLDQGHPVDVRDNNGWIPLHEAANFGYIDIVKELLDRGAAINDRGGPSCGGITPLIDAASCGHLEVMKLLLDKGASPTMRTNKGETVLDCLKEWRNRYTREERRDLDSETLAAYNSMVYKIKTAIEKAGHTISKTAPSSSSHEHITNTVRGSGQKVTIEAKSNSDVPKRKVNYEMRRTVEDVDLDDTFNNRRRSDDAVVEYEAAMRAVKHHRPGRKEMPVSPLKESQDPLLQPDHVVNDWLIDDLGDNVAPRPTKRQRKNEFVGRKFRDMSSSAVPHPPRPLSQSSYSSENQDTESQSQSSPRIDIDFDVGTETTEIDNKMEDCIVPSLDSEEIDLDFNSHHETSNRSQLTKKRQATLLSTGISRHQIPDRQQAQQNSNFIPEPSFLTGSTIAAPASQTFMGTRRTIKVLVEGKLLLIVLPNDPNLMMSWLANEAARRYKSMEGVEPELSLKTVEGALLFPQDPLSLVLELGSEIHATVTSWNVIPIPQIYKEACAASNVGVNMQVDSQLDACQATSCFILEDCILNPNEMRPVFKALSHYHSLQHIRLSGNVLGDSELKVLAETLVRFQKLQELDISCNNITSDGFSYMCQHVSQNRGFQSLEVLDISFNQLGDNCLHSLSVLMPFATSLHTLRLASVSLSSFTAPPGFSLENLEDLNISYNKIGQEGARGFLSILNPERICSLNFAAVGKYAVREVAMFLGQSIPHKLVYLNLSYCDIDNCDMVSLLENLNLCPQLQKLDLAGNGQLSKVTVHQLLQLPLTEVNLAGIECHHPLVTDIANLCISSCSSSNWGDRGPFSFATTNLKSLLNIS